MFAKEFVLAATVAVLQIATATNWGTVDAAPMPAQPVAEKPHDPEFRLDAGTPELRIRRRSTSLAFSPDGRLLAGNDDHSYYVWDVGTGKLVHQVASRAESAGSIGFASDGHEFLAFEFGRPGVIHRWDVSTWNPLADIVLKEDSDEAFREFQRRLGTTRLIEYDRRSRQIKVIEVDSGRDLIKVNVTRPVAAKQLSPDGRRLVLETYDAKFKNPTFEVWDVEKQKKLYQVNHHTNTVSSVAFTPDSKSVVSSAYNDCVAQWSLADGKLERKYDVGFLRRARVGVSPDGSTLIIANSKTLAHLFNLATGKERARFDVAGVSIQQIAFTTDGKLAALAGVGSHVHVLDVKTGKSVFNAVGHRHPMYRLESGGDAKTVFSWNNKEVVWWDYGARKAVDRMDVEHTSSVSPDGQYIVTSQPYGTTGLVVRGKPESLLRDLRRRGFLRLPAVVSSKGHVAAQARDDGTIRVDIPAEKGGAAQRHYPIDGHEAPIRALAVASDETQLASCGAEKSLRLWDLTAEKPECKVILKNVSTPALAFSPDGESLAGVAEGKIHLWRTKDGQVLRDWPLESPATVENLQFSHDGRLLAAGCGIDGVHAWDVATGKSRWSTKAVDAAIGPVAFCSNGRYLAVGDAQGRVRLLEQDTGRPGPVLPRHHDRDVTALAFSADSARLASGDRGGGVAVWNLEKACVESSRIEPSGLIGAIGFADDGRTARALVRLGRDGWNIPLTAIDARHGKALRGDEQTSGTAFSPDSTTLVVGEPNEITFWDTRSVTRYHRFPTSSDVGRAVAFSPDGRYLAGGGDGIWIWDLESGARICEIPAAQTGNVATLRFMPSGKEVVSGGRFSAIQVWDVRSGKLLTVANTQGPLHSRKIAGTRDGRLLVSYEPKESQIVPPNGRPQYYAVRIRECVTGRVLFDLRHPADPMYCHALTADDSRLLTGLSPGVLLSWDYRKLIREHVLAECPGPYGPDELWRMLASENPVEAHAAVEYLCQQPELARRVLAERLRPANSGPAIDPKTIRSWIDQLSDSRRDVVRKASTNLRDAGRKARPHLEDALKQDLSPAVRARIELLLSSNATTEPIDLGTIRAIEVLERLGGTKAVLLLKSLAGGEQSEATVLQAKSALSRMVSSP